MDVMWVPPEPIIAGRSPQLLATDGADGVTLTKKMNYIE